MAIIRNFETKLSGVLVGQMIHRLAICGGNIINFSAISNGFKPTQVGRWQGVFTLEFPTQGGVNFFHSCGYETTAPEINFQALD